MTGVHATPVRVGAVLVAGLLFLTPGRPAGQAPGALPETESFLAAVRQNLVRSQQQESGLAYKERRTELHMNPFGRIGTGGARVYEVIPGADGMTLTRRLIERDGRPVAASDDERRERPIRRNRTQTSRGAQDVLSTLTFALDRREVIDGRPVIVVTFAPRPGAKPTTRQGRMARVFSGEAWVDEASREVERVEAVAVDNLSMGFGVVARLNTGTRVSVTRRQVAGGLWLPASIRFAGEGRALLFRKLNVNYEIEWFDYREVAAR